MNEHTAILEVDITETLSAVIEAPFVYIRQSRSGPGSRAVNGTMTGTGLGDVRVGARWWFLQSDQADEGEVASSLRLYGLAGLRLPTGESDGKFTSQAGNRVDNDVAVQPGTGNPAAFLELGGTFAMPESYFGLFGSARYILAPMTNARSKNFRNQLSGRGYEYNSDPDSFNAKVGFTFELGRLVRQSVTDEEGTLADGFAMFFAYSYALVPYDDLIGGDSGFRRGAQLMFLEPGVVWALNERVTVNASVPLTVYRRVMKNGGNVPEVVFLAGITITLN